MSSGIDTREVQILLRSLKLFFVIFFCFWVPSFIVVAITNGDAMIYKFGGGSIQTSKLEKFERSSSRAFYSSIGLALAFSQSAVWIAAMTKRNEMDTDPAPTGVKKKS